MSELRYYSASMSGNSQPDSNHQPSPETPKPNSASTHDTRGESQVWAAISTLVAGPAVWGFFGWLADGWFNTTRTFTAVGVVVGFITSLYIVYVRFGKN
jgi:F0F1-type ATP synthase assembly protein I